MSDGASHLTLYVDRLRRDGAERYGHLSNAEMREEVARVERDLSSARERLEDARRAVGLLEEQKRMLDRLLIDAMQGR